jgi:hypothetical protein
MLQLSWETDWAKIEQICQARKLKNKCYQMGLKHSNFKLYPPFSYNWHFFSKYSILPPRINWKSMSNY